MHRKKRIAACIMALAVTGLIFVGDSLAASNTPGSSSDPLVSKSYVDDKYNQILSMIQTGQGGQSWQPDYSSVDTEVIITEVINRLEQQQAAKFIPVQAYANDIIIGGEGTEIILRSGSAIAYSFGSDGLSDITDGKDVVHGGPIYKNHLLIVPRADGRGVMITSEAWFIIKGEYQLISQ